MRRRMSLLVAAVALVASACGTPASSSSTSSSGAASRTASVHKPAPAGPEPSSSARMICSPALQTELVYSLGVKPAAPVVARWVNHRYSCRYVYSNGVMVLSVKELSSWPQTIAYFKMLGRMLGDTGSMNGLGQGAFSTRTGSVAVRKDYRVLLVDIAGLPHRFGVPLTSRADIAITVTDSILACWRGH